MTESEWLTSQDPAAMLGEIIAPYNSDMGGYRASDRKLRLFACACVRQVWGLLTDNAPCQNCNGGPGKTAYTGRAQGDPCPECGGLGRINRSRRAVEVSERFADGEANWEQLRKAAGEAAKAACDNGGPYMEPFWAAEACTGDAKSAADIAIEYRLIDNSVKANLLRCIIGNPFRPVTLPMQTLAFSGQPKDDWSPAPPAATIRHCPWLTPTVLMLAQDAYERRVGRKCNECPKWEGVEIRVGFDAVQAVIDFGERRKACRCRGTCHIDDGSLDPLTLSALADALEEAGCKEQDAGNWRRCHGCGELFVYIHKYSACNSPGCDGEDSSPAAKWVAHPIVAHLRSPGPHVRGCLALDLVRGVA